MQVADLYSPPEGWRRARIDALAAPVRRMIDPSTLGNREVFHISIPALDELGSGRIEAASTIGSQKLDLRGGEVLISRLNPRKSRVLVVASGSTPVLASGEFIALEPRPGCDSRFLAWLLRSDLLRQGLDSHVRSVTRSHQRVDPQTLTQAHVWIPPLDEQRGTADFLDREVARLEAQIAVTCRIERRIKERHRAFMHAEVTGLRTQGPRQDTGVPWLREIPADWEVRRLRHSVRLMQTGSTPPTAADRYYTDGSLPWFGPAAFGEDLAVGTPSKLLHGAAIVDGVAPQFTSGAILVVTIGATTGRVAQLERPGSSNQQVTALVAGEDMEPRFLAWHLKALEPVLRASASVTTLPILGREVFRGIPLAVPPLGEQAAIARRIDDDARRVAVTTQLLRRHTELLTERRDALITAAVTGHLDPSSFRASALTT